MSDEVILRAMRAAHWEQAKGHLRAMAVLMGHHPDGEPAAIRERTSEAWRNLNEHVEEFIKQTEDEGMPD